MTNNQKKQMWKIFKSYGQDASRMTHYDLANEENDFSAEEWKQFLNEPDVLDWIAEEQAIIKRAELSKMLSDIGDSHSTGQAQILSALQRLEGNQKKSEGPIFVYCYVPLSSEQMKAENVRILDKDPFLKIDRSEQEYESYFGENTKK